MIIPGFHLAEVPQKDKKEWERLPSRQKFVTDNKVKNKVKERFPFYFS